MSDIELLRKQDTLLRTIADKAKDDDIITTEEYGFIFTLVEKYRSEIDRKIKQMDILRGQILQLQANEKIIVDLISNLIKAAERSKAREESIERLKSHEK